MTTPITPRVASVFHDLPDNNQKPVKNPNDPRISLSADSIFQEKSDNIKRPNLFRRMSTSLIESVINCASKIWNLVKNLFFLCVNLFYKKPSASNSTSHDNSSTGYKINENNKSNIPTETFKDDDNELEIPDEAFEDSEITEEDYLNYIKQLNGLNSSKNNSVASDAFPDDSAFFDCEEMPDEEDISVLSEERASNSEYLLKELDSRHTSIEDNFHIAESALPTTNEFTEPRDFGSKLKNEMHRSMLNDLAEKGDDYPLADMCLGLLKGAELTGWKKEGADNTYTLELAKQIEGTSPLVPVGWLTIPKTIQVQVKQDKNKKTLIFPKENQRIFHAVGIGWLKKTTTVNELSMQNYTLKVCTSMIDQEISPSEMLYLINSIKWSC